MPFMRQRILNAESFSDLKRAFTPMILLDLNLTASDSFQTFQIPFFLTFWIVDTDKPEKHAYIPFTAHLTVTKIFPGISYCFAIF